MNANSLITMILRTIIRGGIYRAMRGQSLIVIGILSLVAFVIALGLS